MAILGAMQMLTFHWLEAGRSAESCSNAWHTLLAVPVVRADKNALTMYYSHSQDS